MKSLVYANTPDRAGLVLPWIAALAGRTSLEVTVQRIGGGDAVKGRAAKRLEEGISSLDPAPVVRAREGRGAPEEIIAAEAREGDYDLVVLAPAGRQGFNKLFRGSMVAHVVQRVSSSVLVVRDGERVPPGRILACVSGARHALTTVGAAARLAGLFEARLTLLLVLSQLGIGMAGGAPWETEPESFAESDDALAAHLRRAAGVATEEGSPPVTRVRQGLVSGEILKEIREGEHDLLVVGTHRAEDFDTVYEDLTDELVKASPISTLVVGMRAGLT